MIKIKILDKNGNELKNGDTIRYVQILPTYQDEVFLRFKNGITVKIIEYKIEPQSEFDEENMFYIPSPNYTKEELLETCDLPLNVSQDEYEECCLECICSELNIEFTDEKSFFDFINGFEILEAKADAEG
ncbi:hypothetical protein SB581_12240 [Acinetobacter baumannii]|nr:hypothetical protein SB581_12240 [Acinetobacter baumannii]